MKDIIEIVESFKDSGLLLEGVSGTIQNDAKEQKGGFISVFLGTLGASLLGTILSSKGIYRDREGGIAKRHNRGVVRAGYGKKKVKAAKRQGNKTDF